MSSFNVSERGIALCANVLAAVLNLAAVSIGNDYTNAKWLTLSPVIVVDFGVYILLLDVLTANICIFECIKYSQAVRCSLIDIVLPPLYCHYTGQPAFAGSTPVRNLRILLLQSFTGCMPLLNIN